MAGSRTFQNGHYKNAANDRNSAFFQQLAVLSSALMQIHGFLFWFLLFRKRNIDLLATHFARKRNLFVKVQGIEITRCTLAGLMGRADPANAITWKNFSPVSRDPGTAILGSRLTGLGPVSQKSRNFSGDKNLFVSSIGTRFLL